MKDRKKCYDELIMDDIAVGFDGFHPTKEFSDALSPYQEGNEAESKRYRQMHNIFYYFDGNGLYRRWVEKGIVRQEEILYVHFQKRAMKCDRDVCIYNKFSIINNTFVSEEVSTIEDVKKYDVIDDTAHNKLKRLQRMAYIFYRQHIRKRLK